MVWCRPIVSIFGIRLARLAACAALAVLPLVAVAQPPGAGSSFAAASAAFARGDFGEALRSFIAARAASAPTPALDYNIGVCEYKLGDYAAAEASFRELGRAFPAFRALADYNRGLALAKLGRAREARTAFAAAASAGGEAVRRLADAELAALDAGAPTAAQRWAGAFDLAVGHDDDVALVAELSLPAGQAAGSTFTEAVAAASRSFATGVPLRLDVSGYSVRYRDTSQYDQDALRIELTALERPAPWRFEAGPYFDYGTLDGRGLQRILGIDARAQRSVAARASLDLRASYETIDPIAAAYAFLDGTRGRLQAALDFDVRSGRVRAALGLETNDRDDPSVSPERHRVSVAYRRALAPSWWLDGELAYRRSRYGDLAIERREDLTELHVLARRELTGDWTFNVDYLWSDNDATDPAYAYTSRRLGLGASKSF